MYPFLAPRISKIMSVFNPNLLLALGGWKINQKKGLPGGLTKFPIPDTSAWQLLTPIHRTDSVGL